VIKIELNPFNKKSQTEDLSRGSQAPLNDTTVPPTDSVIAMQQQGLSNNQIIEYLQRQGYAPEQVFEAMNQASVKGNIENNFSQNPPLNNPPPSNSFQTDEVNFSNDSEKIERIAEAIIEEKWNELTKHITKIIDWKDKTESKINKIEQEFTDLKKNFDSLHNSILGKVSEYDNNIINLGVEIKAMEKVFQKILPTLTDSVNELSRISKTMKEK
jgi:prefoldin subunit 5